MLTMLTLAALATSPDAGLRMEPLIVPPQGAAVDAPNIRGRLELGTPKVSGTEVSPAGVADFIRRRKAALQACYEKAFRRRPPFKTTVHITFDISPSGRPVDIDATADLADLDDMTVCVRTTVRAWTFPFTPSAPARVELDMRCTPQG